jgi:hypothetical protein
MFLFFQSVLLQLYPPNQGSFDAEKKKLGPSVVFVQDISETIEYFYIGDTQQKRKERRKARSGYCE